MMEEPVEGPGEGEQRDDEDGGDGGGEGREEEPVLPGLAAGVFDVADEQGVVAAVGLPGDVEGVAEEGNRADHDVERQIDDHAGEGDVGDSAHPRGEDKDAGGKAGEDVSDGGDETDDAVEAEADGSAGDAEAVVEEMGEPVEVFIAEEAAAGTEARGPVRGGGRQNLGVFGQRHSLGQAPGTGSESG